VTSQCGSDQGVGREGTSGAASGMAGPLPLAPACVPESPSMYTDVKRLPGEDAMGTMTHSFH
jgi:hypothetical protein